MLKARIVTLDILDTFNQFFYKAVENANAIVLDKDGGIIALCTDPAVAQGIKEAYDEGKI